MLKAFAAVVLLVCAPPSYGGDLRYLVSIGDREVSAGKLSFHWYGWGSYKVLPLGEIRDGQLELPDPTGPFLESVYRGYGYEPDQDNYDLARIFSSLDGWFITVELPGPVYYRSDDVPTPDVHECPLDPAALGDRFARSVVEGIPSAVTSLGRSVTTEGGVTKLVLPEPKTRVITFLDLESGPAADMVVHLSVFGTRNNHCGVHRGISLGAHTTNQDGEVRLLLPESTPIYYEDVYHLPAGGSYAGVEQHYMEIGMLVGAGDRVEARWHFEPRPLVITVLDRTGGSPVEGVFMSLCLRTWGPVNECLSMSCGATCGPAGTSGADGLIRFEMTPENRCGLRLYLDGTTVSIEEHILEELYRTGSAAVALKP